MPYGPPGRRSAASARRRRRPRRRAARRPGVGDVARSALQARDVGRTDARRGAADPPEGARVVELEHALAHRDDGDPSPAVKRGDAAGLRRHVRRGHDLPAAHDAQRVAALVAHEHRAAGRRHVVGVGAGAHAAAERPVGERDLEQAVGRLGRRQDRATGTREREVARRARQDDAAAHDAGGSVDQCEHGRIAQRHGDQAAGGVGHDAFGTIADRGHPAGRGVSQGRRARRLRRRRQLMHCRRATARPAPSARAPARGSGVGAWPQLPTHGRP